MRFICIICITLFLSFFVFAEIPVGYYDSCEGLVEDALRLELENIISTNINTSYTASKGIMYSEIDNDNGVIKGVYSGFEVNHPSGNTTTPTDIDCEHSYCQSWIDMELTGSENSIAKADIHHLFPTKSSVNIARSNNPLDFVAEISYTYTEDGGNTVSYLGTSAETEAVFEPADEHKGDVARALMYFVVRYETNLTFGNVDMLETMLGWHYDDPVSSKEINRNDAVFDYQTNRNPFIDHPEYIDLIWNEEPSITLTFPNEAIILGSNLSYSITWFTHYFYRDVRIELLNTESGINSILENATENDGNWEWTVADDIIPSENYRLRISDANDPTLYDESDYGFTIVQTASQSDLFFSEYCEGSSYNKYLEIYNGTGALVDLTEYRLEMYNNGNTSPNYVLNFSGLINTDEMIIVSHPSAEEVILEQADITYGGLLFNGDDAVALFRNDVLIDIIGEIGIDPGSSWEIAGNSSGSKDKTITRKSTIEIGSVNWLQSAGTDPDNSAWIVHDLDFFNDLGIHNMEIQLDIPQNVALNVDGNNLTLNWDPVSRATYYVVYSSNDVNTGFEQDNNGSFYNSSWIAPLTEEIKFYQITAQ
jgi:Endonuclease I/Lamin Tail Domain